MSILVIIKRVSNNEILSRELRGGSLPTDAEFLAGAVTVFGGAPQDYNVVRSTGAQIIARVTRGDEFTLDASNVFSFAIGDAKRFLLASVNKTEVNNDGVDFAVVTLQARNTNASGDIGALATGVNGTIKVLFDAPWGTVKARCTFVNGVATKRLRRRNERDEGFWKIPSESPSPAYKTRPVGVVVVEIEGSLEDDV